MSDIEIIAITTCGTYPSWVDYAIASVYNHVDKVVVINSGYNIKDPGSGAIYSLERDHENIKKIDIHKKIIEVTPAKDKIEQLFSTMCKRDKDEFGRATNITFSTQVAHNLPNPKHLKRYMLKFDSDQIFSPITRKQLEDLISSNQKSGYRFAQYADYLHDLEHITGSLPDEFTNDGALLYIDLPGQRYGGQGSPDTHTEQYPIYNIRTYHMRRINPPGVDTYEYHFKRFWYHTWGPNSIGEHGYNRDTGKKLTNEKIAEIAHNSTIDIIRNKGVSIDSLPWDQRIPYEKPLVCILTPLEYIKKGY